MTMRLLNPSLEVFVGFVAQFSIVVWSYCSDISRGSVFCSIVFWLLAPLFPNLFHLSPFTFGPITSLSQALMIGILHFASSGGESRTLPNLWQLAWLDRVSSAPLLHILNTLRGVFHIVLKWSSISLTYSPLIEEGLVLLCASILGNLMCCIWVGGIMEGNVRVIFKLFHSLTWPPLIHSLSWFIDRSSLARGGA